MSALPSAVIVFGASGFVGRNLVDALSGRFERLVGVTAGTPHVSGCTETVTMDRLDTVLALPADTVAIHVAAYRYDAGRFDLAQSDIIRHNSALNTSVFQFCAERGIREVRMASSVAVYPAALDVMDDAAPVDLNQPPHEGEAFYAWSKRWAEVLANLYASRFGVNTIAFRLSNPYGPYDSTNPMKAHVAPAFVMKALDNNSVFPIRGDVRVERDFTYVGDVVEVFLRSLSWRGRQDVFNICTGQTRTLEALAKVVMRTAGVEKAIEAGAPGAFGPAKRISTSDRLKAEMGVSFRPLEDGMRPTVEWYRNAMA